MLPSTAHLVSPGLEKLRAKATNLAYHAAHMWQQSLNQIKLAPL